MSWKLKIDVEEAQMFQGTDVQRALLDAEMMLEDIGRGSGKDVYPNMAERDERVQRAKEVLNKLIFEIDMERKHYLCQLAEEAAHRDANVIRAMAGEYPGYFWNVAHDDQKTALLIGDPSETVLPWWSNLPGGREVANWADDFGLEVRTAYEERMANEIALGGQPIEVGDVEVMDNCLWVHIRSEVRV